MIPQLVTVGYMGWVKERIDRERKLESQLPVLWARLGQSIDRAAAEWRSEAGGLLSVTAIRDGMVLRVVNEKTSRKADIAFNPIEPCVTYRDARIADKHLGFGWDGNDVSFTMDGKPVGVEMACRLLTEPLFE